MNTLAEHRSAIADGELRSREANAFRKFFQMHPDLNMQANEQMLRDIHHGEEITVETLEESVRYLGDSLARKSEQAVTESREQEAERIDEERRQEKGRLIREITGRMRGSGATTQSIELEVKNRYQFMSNAELQAVVENVELEKSLRNKSTNELRSQIRREHATIQPVLPAEHTRESLLAMVKNDYPAFKALVHKFGSALIDERLGVTKLPQPGTRFAV